MTLNDEKIVAVTSAVEQFRKQLESILERDTKQLPSGELALVMFSQVRKQGMGINGHLKNGKK